MNEIFEIEIFILVDFINFNREPFKKFFIENLLLILIFFMKTNLLKDFSF